MAQVNKTILIIEDNIDLVNIYRLKFTQGGYNVLTATDGETGLEIIINQKPDVVLLDMLLPEMDGFSVLKKTKSDPKTSKIKVIVFTNLEQEGDIAKIFKLGADDCLIKASFTPEEVYQRVEAVINKN